MSRGFTCRNFEEGAYWEEDSEGTMNCICGPNVQYVPRLESELRDTMRDCAITPVRTDFCAAALKSRAYEQVGAVLT